MKCTKEQRWWTKMAMLFLTYFILSYYVLYIIYTFGDVRTNYQTKFYINISQCLMTNLELSSELDPFLIPDKEHSCSEDELITSSYDMNLKRYKLHITKDSQDLRCCYSEVVRQNGADSKFILLPCVIFHQNFVVPNHVEGLIVNCTNSKNSRDIQLDAIAFIQQRNLTSTQPESFRKPSLILIGMDSVSRMNLRRSMPNTFEFLKDNQWFELQGYNKVGDKTFANLMPFLTGKYDSNIFKNCNPKQFGGLDKCQFIWNYFKNASYATAYAEDIQHLSTFNNDKKGFTFPPTDYYMRPFNLAIEKNLPKRNKYGLIYCLGRKRYAEYIYDYAQDFAIRYLDQSAFGLFWTNSISHQHYGGLGTSDLRMRQYMQDFKTFGVLDNAIVVFFSDHGLRFGPITQSSYGFYEERLPMFFMSLPKWFQVEYPQFVKSLRINEHRLTTPLDIYSTMQHLLHLNDSQQDLPHASDVSKSQSIFFEIPENRTCKEAGIPEHWCSCNPYRVLSVNETIIRTVLNLIIDQINNYFHVENITLLCKTLLLDSIDLAEEKIPQLGNSSTYRIKFSTFKNHHGQFQVTTVYNILENTTKVNLDDISRLDSYENDSKCIDNSNVKKICFCK